MIISIASGKGGTGKTTVAVSLAMSVPGARLLDCDVEEPNDHIFLKPRIDLTRTVSIPVPEIDETLCTYCGKCQEVCVYNALAVINKRVLTFHELCHGCGSCSYFCPVNAIREVDKDIGVVETGKAGDLDFVHGRLNIGEPMAPPLIRAVREYVTPDRINVIDAPPGTSCPVIAAVKGSDYCVLVTEPTPFGLNDLKLAVEVVRKLEIPFGVLINRSDLGDTKTTEFCSSQDIPILMQIPFRKEFAAAYSRGEPLVSACPEYRTRFQEMVETIRGVCS